MHQKSRQHKQRLREEKKKKNRNTSSLTKDLLRMRSKHFPYTNGICVQQQSASRKSESWYGTIKCLGEFQFYIVHFRHFSVG